MEQGLQFLLASLVVLAFGIGMLLMGRLSGKKRRDILQNGEETTGTVVSIDRCFDDNRYQHKISYRTRDGRVLVGKWDEFHSLPYCKKHPVGSHYQIVYLPDSPGKFVVKDSQGLNAGFAFMSIFGAALIALSIFILFSGFGQSAF